MMVAIDTPLTNQRAPVLRGKGVNRTYYTSAYLSDTFTRPLTRTSASARPPEPRRCRRRHRQQPGLPQPGPRRRVQRLRLPLHLERPLAPSGRDLRPGRGTQHAGSRLLRAVRDAARHGHRRLCQSQRRRGMGGVSLDGPQRRPSRAARRDHDPPTPLATGGGSTAAPTAVVSSNRIDPNLQAPITNEGVFGLDRELAAPTSRCP